VSGTGIIGRRFQNRFDEDRRICGGIALHQFPYFLIILIHIFVDGVLIDPQILCYLAVGDAVSVFEYDLLLGFQIYHFLSLFLLSV
jgi:hypothetical protein